MIGDREDFEEAASRLGYNLTMAEHETGEYHYPVTQDAWDMWQECCDKARAGSGEVVAEVIATGEFGKKWVNIDWLNVEGLEPGTKLYTRPSASVPESISTEDDVERVAKLAGWDNRKYMTPQDYAIWCERMREFVRLSATPQPAPSVPEGIRDRLEHLLQGFDNLCRNLGEDPYLWGYSNAMRKEVQELLATTPPRQEGE